MRQLIRGLLIAVVAMLFVQPPAWAGQPPSVDVFGATVNGTPFFTLSLDQLTDLLGRPSALDDVPVVADTVGPRLHYHHYGLSFWCKPKKEDPRQHCWMMTISLSKAWDADHREFFLPFSGMLTPSLNANWKRQRVETEFAQYGPKVQTAEERDAELATANLPIKVTPAQHDMVLFDRKTHVVRLLHEKTTQFLERIVIQEQEPSRSR